MQYPNLSRLDNTLKNKVLWPDGWMKWHESPAVWILRMAKFHVTLAKEKFCIMNLIAGGRSHVYNLFSDATWTPSSRRCNNLFIPSALFLMYCSVWEIQLEIVLVNPDTLLYFTTNRLSWCSGTMSSRSVSDIFWYITLPPQANGFFKCYS